MDLIAASITRPVATCMFFVAVALLGIFAVVRIPIELIPALNGDKLYVTFARPGASSEQLERDILLPLESRVRQLSGITETWAEIGAQQTKQGLTGVLTIGFESGSNHRVRETELRRIAAGMQREQPSGTQIRVSSRNWAALSRFVATIQVVGGGDENALRELVEQQIQPNLAALEDVGQVVVRGGASKEVTILLDRVRMAELHIRPADVVNALQHARKGKNALGRVELDSKEILVVLDTTSEDLVVLEELKIIPGESILLRHIAAISIGHGRQTSVYRVNGETSVGILVFQNEGGNLVELGQRLRDWVQHTNGELNQHSVELLIDFDAAQKVEEQLSYLKQVAVSGFAIALLVLFLFLRKMRAVAVVAIAIPVSLLAACAMLYLAGYSLNLYTLLGLVIGIGMLVDNSIVVYEAVQNRLEKNDGTTQATLTGVRRTLRAILTASATNGIVFVPLLYFDQLSITTRGALENIVPAVLFPLAASLLVAIGLVPLLAERLAARAISSDRVIATATSVSVSIRSGGFAKALVLAILKVALRKPAAWLTVIGCIVFATVVIALPWVLVQSIGQPQQASVEIKTDLTLINGATLASADQLFAYLEQGSMAFEGVEKVVVSYQEDQGFVRVNLKKQQDATQNNAAKVRQFIRTTVNNSAIAKINAVEAGQGSADALTADKAKIALSGPDMLQLRQLAQEIKGSLQSIPFVGEVSVSGHSARQELRLKADSLSLAAYSIQPEQVFGALAYLGREGHSMEIGYPLRDSRELPVIVRHDFQEGRDVIDNIMQTLVATDNTTLALSEYINVSRYESPPVISHHNGRRELLVYYQLNETAPSTGPELIAIEKKIQNELTKIHQPKGYSIEFVVEQDTQNWVDFALIPVLFLLYAVLAISFESISMPLLVLLSMPLTSIGAIWALVVAGIGIDSMALVGVIVLVGMTVNPAILLVDRMQQKIRLGFQSSGAAALSSVRERIRPVLMTSCTTIAALWPIALSASFEVSYWPPFATVVIGGLVSSTLLTLLVIPVGYVLLSRLDENLGRLGSRLIVFWLGVTALVISVVKLCGWVDSWVLLSILATVLSVGLLWIMLRLTEVVQDVPINASNLHIETRFLSKIYGRPGPIGQVWIKYYSNFGNKASASAKQGLEQILVTLLYAGATTYLVLNVQSLIWQIMLYFVAGGFYCHVAVVARRQYVMVSDSDGFSARTDRFEKYLRVATPWLVFVLVLMHFSLVPAWLGNNQRLTPLLAVFIALLILIIQQGRQTVVKAAAMEQRKARRWRNLWQALRRRMFFFAKESTEFRALSSLNFQARPGMIGVLGPNGAGKTTFFRLLASILEPSVGTLYFANINKKLLGNRLAKLIGFLPQEFGLPEHFTPKEYLEYYALLYRIGDKQERAERISRLIGDVGLEEKQDNRIKDLSGGMKQRVAVARTLLSKPPIIIVDEPTAGLDPREKIRFRNLLVEQSKQSIVFFSTHVIEDVAACCDRVVVMKKGQLIFDDIPQRLAHLAEGKIWTFKSVQSEVRDIEERFHVIQQIPEHNSTVFLRVLADECPYTGAKLTSPTLEDGYVQLLYGDTEDE